MYIVDAVTAKVNQTQIQVSGFIVEVVHKTNVWMLFPVIYSEMTQSSDQSNIPF